MTESTLYYSFGHKGFYDSRIHMDLPEDAMPLSDETHKALLAAQASGLILVPGEDGLPVAVSPPPASLEEMLEALRAQRDRLLRESDFTQIPDAPLSADARAAWASYRQALRDLPELYADDPASAVWPIPPSAEPEAAEEPEA